MNNNIMNRVLEHYQDALTLFDKNRIVCVSLHGSQNYGLDTPKSDVDTKLIVTSSFKDIALNKELISHTHVRDNNEHIDEKDIRLYLKTMEKQNLNFMEILFTSYSIVNPLYEKEWNRLIENREMITHYDKSRAVKSMYGVALNKYKSLEKVTPARKEIVEKYGYDPKQLCHLVRIEDFLYNYLRDVPYEQCLKTSYPSYLIQLKEGLYDLHKAKAEADLAFKHIQEMCDTFLQEKSVINKEAIQLLEDVQYNIMKISITKELSIKGD